MEAPSFVVCSCSVFLLAFVILLPSAPVDGLSADEQLFDSFVTKYGKAYRNDSTEYQKRFQFFKESLVRHKKLNSYRSHPQDAYFGVTRFADLTPEEFGATVLGGRAARPAAVAPATKGGPDEWPSFRARTKPLTAWARDIPKKYTLQGRKPPVLTPVKDQGSCGGCWAFSIVECVETQHALQTHTLYDLSVQQVIDCNNVSRDHGCDGGNLCDTLGWLQTSKEKIVLDKLYPYKEEMEVCQKKAEVFTRDPTWWNDPTTLSDLYSCRAHGLVSVTNYTCTGYVDREQVMVSLIADHGPLLAAVDATSFQDYMGGIIQHHCTSYDNHAVQIVGYDQTGDVPYYIVRNSWGKDWGLQGYLHIKIGGNLCGIANTVGSLSTS